MVVKLVEDVATVVGLVSGSVTLVHYATKAVRWLVETYRPVVVKKSAAHLQGSSSFTVRPIKVTVTDELGITDKVTSTVGKSLGLRWTVEAPTPSLGKRLTDEGLELLSWYLRHA